MNKCYRKYSTIVTITLKQLSLVTDAIKILKISKILTIAIADNVINLRAPIALVILGDLQKKDLCVLNFY